MTPQEIAAARRMRKAGVSDAAIAADMHPPVTRQHVHKALGPRKRAAKPAASPAPAAKPVDFANEFRAWRAMHGLTQVGAARLLQVKVTAVQQWEQNRRSSTLAPAVLLLMKLITKDMNR